jgi:predicted GH43/DUF377 family glycosyl hydrolase
MTYRYTAAVAALTLVLSACGTSISPGAGSTTPPSEDVTTTGLRAEPGGGSSDPTESTSTTTTTTVPDRVFGLSGALSTAGSEDWHSAFIVPGPVVEHEDVYYMFYMGHKTEGAGVDRGAVGYLTSPDGVFWTFENPNPLFDAAERDWAANSIQPSSAMILEDGTWAIWFSSLIRPFGTSGPAVGRATAPGPDGPWTVDAEPALVAGGEGAWNAKGVMHPSVIRVGAEWRMYFDGFVDDIDSERDRAIGLATSDDGLTWTLHNNPDTDGPYALSDPVFFPGQEGAWDEFRARSPSVVEVDGRYIMTYMSTWRLQPAGSGFRSDFGYATSDDGISWTRGEGNPLIPNTGKFGFITDGFGSIVEGDLVIYFDGASSIFSAQSATFGLFADPGDL